MPFWVYGILKNRMKFKNKIRSYFVMLFVISV